MSGITLKSSLKKRGIVMTFLIICSLFIIENAFSIRHWDQNLIKTYYVKKFNSIAIHITFFAQDLSENKENSYLERCKFEYSTDGENYKTFMRSETYNQKPIDDIFNPMYWVTLTHKLDGVKIRIFRPVFSKNELMWDDSTIQHVAVYTFNGLGILTLGWQLENLKIKNIRVTGKWTLKGLTCPDYFSKVYDMTPHESDQLLKLNDSEVNRSEYNAAKVFKQADVIVIKGAVIGENINIYTTSGAKIKSIVTNKELITINLPANQMYIVNIGQTRYKIAL